MKVKEFPSKSCFNCFCFTLQLSCLDKDKCVSIQMPFNSGSSVCAVLMFSFSTRIFFPLFINHISDFPPLFCNFLGFQKSTSQQVHVTISAEEIGGRDKSPYNSYTCSDISSPSLSRIIR